MGVLVCKDLLRIVCVQGVCAISLRQRTGRGCPINPSKINQRLIFRTGLVAKKTEVGAAILKEGGQRKSIGSVVMPSPIWIIYTLMSLNINAPNFRSAYLFSFALVAPRTRIKRKSIAKVKEEDRLSM